MTIDEIAERLAVSRTTVFYWVGDIPIERKPATGWPDSVRRKGNEAMRRKYERLREAAYERGMLEFLAFERQVGFRDFVCLYIAEGKKRDRNRVAIGNSDPAVMVLAQRWMKSLSANPLCYAVQYHADQDVNAVKGFWARTLGIGPELVKVQRKSNSNRLNGRDWRSPHGVLTIEAGDTYFRAELQAWMDWVQDEWLDSAAQPARGVAKSGIAHGLGP